MQRFQKVGKWTLFGGILSKRQEIYRSILEKNANLLWEKEYEQQEFCGITTIFQACFLQIGEPRTNDRFCFDNVQEKIIDCTKWIDEDAYYFYERKLLDLTEEIQTAEEILNELKNLKIGESFYKKDLVQEIDRAKKNQQEIYEGLFPKERIEQGVKEICNDIQNFFDIENRL